ncbi:SpoIID/LytB domain-containing protein [Thermus thermophilus]|uniref:SpoIID/LytB domain-containing protein n=1 Tax=Thermus thermophilus TaxID=274 RepID=UPI0003A89E83|nr:SpoIID/LytB domain-containing protein [Thermus thermophilus]
MKRLWAWVGLLALVLAALGQKAPGLEALLVRVLLKEVGLGEEVRLALPTGEVALRGQAEGVVVEGRLLPSWAVEGPYFALEKRPYRGGLVARVEGGRLLLVNVLPLEDYLLGVLPAEMPASFPEEALKAQAVLARTFAVRRLNPLASYDLCATEACQVYLGLSAETPRHERAVRATEGRVLSYAGQVASALYHADSGGMTAGSEEVFQKALPYLRPRPDPYAKGPKSVWQQAVRPEEAARALRALGYAPRGDDPPQVLEKSPSGRAWRVRLLGVEVRGPEAQRLLRLMGLPSAMAEFQGWLALGRGAGHGVGLSQWGAKGMAERGYGYREILGHYFPGTLLSPLEVAAR